MCVWQFRDLSGIEALVLAADYERAAQLFEGHLRAHGGDADSLLWRELALDHLQDEAEAAVREALGLGREGLVSCDAANQWVFVVPLGGRQEALNEG